MKVDIDKKKIQKVAKEQLSQGLPKQEVYEHLVEKFRYRKEIAKIIKGIPTKERLSKYGGYNIAFLVFICLITIFLLLYPNFSLIWMFWIIYIVAFRKLNLYYWVTLLGVTSGIALIGNVLSSDVFFSDEHAIPMFAGFLLFSLVFVLAGIYLPKLLSPPYTEWKESYLNANGVKKIRVVHKFEE